MGPYLALAGLSGTFATEKRGKPCFLRRFLRFSATAIFFSANLISVIGIAADLGFLAVQLYDQWFWQKKYSETQSQRNNIEFGLQVPEGPQKPGQ